MKDSQIYNQYSVKDFFRNLSVEEFIYKYRNADVFAKYCVECNNYGKSWGCPPFDFDIEERLRQYDNVLLVVTQIYPSDADLSINVSQELIRPERIRLERRLLDLESAYNGLSATYVGSCLYCPEGTCTRPYGKMCRHPECVRPSLEGYGFDIGKITNELFGLELRWGNNGKIPEYLLLVCALFHNESSVEFT